MIIGIVPHNNKLTQNCSDLAELFCRTKRYGFEYEILMFPEARHDDQVDSTVQYLQWMRKTNTNAFRVRDFGLNPNKTLRWLRAVKLISLTLTYWECSKKCVKSKKK